MANRLEALFEDIEKLEKDIRKKHPKQRGRVLIANAKQRADYESSPDNDVEWAHNYKLELEKEL